MARLFVMNDNQSARVEIMQDDTEEELTYVAVCFGCSRDASSLKEYDLLFETSERSSLADAEQVASNHVDQCRRCADANCHAVGRHDAGRRCRFDWEK